MHITLEPTATIERVNGVPARLWTGRTDQGIEITAWINFVRVRADADAAAFEASLQTVEVHRELVSFDMRMVL